MGKAAKHQYWTNRSVQAVAWSCFILLTMLTVLLFTKTGGAVASRFRTWDELACLPYWADPVSNQVPRFACMSKCSQYYATFRMNNDVRFKYITLSDGQHPRAADIEIRQWDTGQVVCRIGKTFGIPKSMLVNRQLNVVVLQEGLGASTVYDLSTGMPERSFPEGMRCFAIAPDGKSVLYTDGHQVKLESLSEREVLISRKFDWCNCISAFFDISSRPKIYLLKQDENLETSGTELWDFQAGQCDWSSKNAEVCGEPSGSFKWVLEREGDETSLHISFVSLADRHTIGSHSFVRGQWEDVRSIWPGPSPSGRYFLYKYQHSILPGRVMDWISSKQWLDYPMDVLQTWLPILSPQITWQLEDFSTRSIQSLKGLNPSDDVSQGWDAELRALQTQFHEADYFDANSEFYTLDSHGIYIWDLPPRMRWFTPWAWASLAAWLGLGRLLFGRRRRSRSLDTSHRIETPQMAAPES